MDGMHDLGGKQGFGRGPPLARRARPSTSRGRSASTRSTRSRSSSASSTWTSTATRSSAWSRATICRRATTSARSPAWRRSASRRASCTREELERRAEGAFPLALAERARPHQRGRRASASSRATASACATDHVPGHVRMPGYIRGKTGVVVGESPAYPFPDAHAHGVDGRGRADLRRALQQPRTCGRTRPIRRSCMSACSRAIWNDRHPERQIRN